MTEVANRKYVLLGGIALLVLALVVGLALAQYNRAFDRVVPIAIDADRSGLLMEAGAPVKLRGVEVGRVSEVRTDGSGARLAVELRPEQAERVPAQLSAHLVPATVFGAKFVELRPTGSGEHIEAGAVIDRAHVTVELNDTFQTVVRTLDAVPPSKLNGALTAVADSLRGNGNRVGSLVVDLDGYLRSFNPQLPALEQRIPEIGAVAENYRGITDDLASTAANLGGTSNTLVERQRAFSAFLLSMTQLGNNSGRLLEHNGDQLVTMLDALHPTADLAARYAPGMPCFFRGVQHNGDTIRAATGGPGSVHPNAHVTMSQLPGIPPYTYPQNLPKTGLDTGPDCHGLPVVHGIPPFVNYDTGANPYPGKDETTKLSPETLAIYLFGPLPPPGGGR